MRDGRTRKLGVGDAKQTVAESLARWQASIVIVSGGATGCEYLLDRETTSLGRGPGVVLAFDDPAMSRAHAAIEFAGDGFRIRDLGSTNGVSINGCQLKVGDLKHGDRLQFGGHVFQFVLEKRERKPKTYLLPEA